MRSQSVLGVTATSILVLLHIVPGAALGEGSNTQRQPPVGDSPTGKDDRTKGPEQATTGPETASPVTLEPIVVTATRSSNSVFDSSMSLTLVGKAELLERSIRTPAEALRYKPGIWVQKTGHLGGAPVLRGFIGNRVIYLFDGIRRNTAGLFKGPNSFLQNIDALDVDRVEVIRGPGSVLYGSDAIGGIVNVITNEQPVFSEQLRFGGRTYARYASVDKEMSARAEIFASSPNLYVFLGGTHRKIGDLKGGGSVGVQRPSGWRENNWDFQVDYLVAPGHRLEFFAQDFYRPDGRRFDRPNWRQTNRRELYGLRYFGEELGFADDLQVTAYYHRQDNFIDERFWDSDSVDKTFGVEAQATSVIGDSLHLVYGFHYHHDDVKKSNPQAGTRDPDVDWRNVAIFVLTEWQATDRLRLDLGLRWDRFTLQSKSPRLSRLDPAVQNAISSGSFSLSSLQLDEADNAVTGGLGAVFALTEHLNLVGHIGRAFRAPNKSDMLSFGQFTFGFNVPSPGLTPESSWTYELGLKASHPNFSGALTGFYTRVKNPIISRPGSFGGSSFIDVNGDGVQDPDEGVFVNTNSSDNIIAYGAELEWNWYLPKQWTQGIADGNALSAYGNASWIFGTEGDEPLDRAFPANALLGIRLENDRNPELRKWWVAFDVWIVDGFSRIPSRRQNRDPAFRLNPQDKNSPLLRSDGSVPGFTTYNIHSGVKLAKNVTLTVGVENLTDKKFRVKDSRIDGPGLNFVVGLEVLF